MPRRITNSVSGNNWEGEWEFRRGNRIEIRHGVSRFFPNHCLVSNRLRGNLRENFIPFFG